MSNLLLKEWVVNKSTILSGIIVMVIAVFLISDIQVQLPIYIAIFFGCLYPFASDRNENMNKSNILINSLPVNRKEIIASKYAFSLLLGSLLTIVLAVLNMIIPSFEANHLFDIILSISAVGLFIAIYYPLLYLLGSRFVLYGMIIVLSVGAAIVPIIINMGLNNNFWGLAAVFQQFSSTQLSIAFIGITVIVLIISWLISYQIYKDRQL